MAAKMASCLLGLCAGSIKGLDLKKESAATRKNKFSATLLSGDVSMTVRGAEISMLAQSLKYWSWMELVEELSLGVEDRNFFDSLLVMAVEVIEVE